MKLLRTKDIILFSIATAIILSAGCFRFLSAPVAINSHSPQGRTVYIETTGYCACEKCCSWERNWRFQPVFSNGPNKGKVKKIGICADGTLAKRGTLAADTRYFPFGTKIHIPGYGMGTVHDRGGAIKGRTKLDLFFQTHQQALNWGRKKIKVTIYN